MLKPKRVDAGLGDPPTEYTSNDVEAANFMVKHGLSFHPKKPHEFIEEVKNIIDLQYNNEERAVFNRGPYEVAHAFKHLSVDDSKWNGMNLVQRKAAIKKFMDAGVDILSNQTEEAKEAKTPADDVDLNTESGLHKRMTIFAADSGITTIPMPILQTMFEKADKLVSTDGNVILKPGGTDGAYVVAGHSNRILIVTPGKGGALSCDRSCPNRSTRLCEHALAVAAHRGSLKEFIAWFKRSKNGPNLTAMALHGAPKTAGKKQSTRKRTNKKKDPITMYVDMLSRECDQEKSGAPYGFSPQKNEYQSAYVSNRAQGNLVSGFCLERELAIYI